MSYEALCTYLLSKYGGAVVDFFYTPECKSKNKKVSRTGEGLFCHHIDEDKGICLSDRAFAKTQPFEWQKKERLVYCNILEHLILHLKIKALNPKEQLKAPIEIQRSIPSGISLLCRDINDMYMNDGTSHVWRKRCFEEIRDNYYDYINLLKALTLYIDKHYTGKRDDSPSLVPGSIVHFAGSDHEIILLNEAKDKFLLKLPNGENRFFSTSLATQQLSYLESFDRMVRMLSHGYNSFYEKILSDITNESDNIIAAEYCNALDIDDYGFALPPY